MAEKSEEDLLDVFVAEVERAAERKSVVEMLGLVAVSLYRVARAQEKLVALAELDLSEQVESEVQSRAETLAQEIEADKTKRSFIGRK